MKKFVMMVGLSGSGKSTHARTLAKLEGVDNGSVVLIESDAYRASMFDGKQDKETHIKLFDFLHSEILSKLSEGKNVIFDATNLSHKNRVHILEKIDKKFNRDSKTVQTIAHVVATQIEFCIERSSMRKERVVEKSVILRQRENFTMPQYNEGFDEIHISYNYSSETYKISSLHEKTKDFSQDNPHHSSTVWEHSMKVFDGLVGESVELRYAGLFHDIGKEYTKLFQDSRGNPSEIAHFYNHENVSSYEAIFYLFANKMMTDDVIYTCGLIQNHMRLYGCSTDKAHDKLRNQVGELMYDDLIKLNNADIAGK